MYPTAFFPVFLIFLIYAFRGPSQWAVATAIACFFQASTPILVLAGGRASGLAPAYCLLVVGFWHAYWIAHSRAGRAAANFELPSATWWLLLFTIVGVVGAVIWPRFFEGAVRALPSRQGLDSGFVEPVGPKATNYIQAFYLVCNFLLFSLFAYLLQVGSLCREVVLKGIIRGALIAVALGIYQVVGYQVGLPWPADIINSNIGVLQPIEQTAMGLRRMSSTFIEPSQMAMHFLGAFGLAGLGLRRKWPAVLILGALLISTSSTAYFGLAILIVIWIAIDFPARGAKALPIATLILLAVVVAYAADQVFTDGRLSEGLIFRKFEGSSGKSRLHADWLALQTFLDSYGMGVGVGSARASSTLATLAATTGLPGLIALTGFLYSVFRMVWRSRDDLDRAALFGLLGLLTAWMISQPDLSIPLFWVLAGIATGGVAANVEGHAFARAGVAPEGPRPKVVRASHRESI